MTITKSSAERIAKAACDKQFEKERLREAQTEDRLARSAYNSVYPKKERDAALDFPNSKKWFPYKNQLVINVAGQWHHLHLKDGEYLPLRHIDNRNVVPQSPLSEEILSFISARDQRNKERDAIRTSLVATILSARTYKKLALGWPEGKQFFEKELEAEGKPGQQVALSFDAINASLGLTKRKAQHSAPVA